MRCNYADSSRIFCNKDAKYVILHTDTGGYVTSTCEEHICVRTGMDIPTGIARGWYTKVEIEVYEVHGV